MDSVAQPDAGSQTVPEDPLVTPYSTLMVCRPSVKDSAAETGHGEAKPAQGKRRNIRMSLCTPFLSGLLTEGTLHNLGGPSHIHQGSQDSSGEASYTGESICGN